MHWGEQVARERLRKAWKESLSTWPKWDGQMEVGKWSEREMYAWHVEQGVTWMHVARSGHDHGDIKGVMTRSRCKEMRVNMSMKMSMMI